MNKKIFKRYDIRGIFGQEFDAKDAHKIAMTLAEFFKAKVPGLETVFVGRDSRASSPEIFTAVTQGLTDQGLSVADVGVCPTPVISSLVKNGGAQAGLMITASHNPAHYNGIKVYCQGDQIWGDEIAKIGETATQLGSDKPSGQKLNKVQVSSLAEEKYLKILSQEFSDLSSSKLKFAIDPLEGAATNFVGKIGKALGIKNAHIISDPTRKISQPDPTRPENLVLLKKTIAEKNLDFGVAFDGDADRMIAVDKNGRIIDGDWLISIFCIDTLKNMPGQSVVIDVKTSDMVQEVASKIGGQCFYAPTGNPLVQKEAMARKAVFCGEASCHFTFFDSGTKVDDGIYAWLRLTKILATSSKGLAEMVDELPKKSRSPEILLKYSDEAIAKKCIDSVKDRMTFHGARLSGLDGLKARTKSGWGLIRKSNTQPILSLRFEANDEQDLKLIKKYFADSLKDLVDKRELEQLFE